MINPKIFLHIGLCSLGLLTTLCTSQFADAKPKLPEAKGLEAGGVVMHPGAKVALAYDNVSNQNVNDGRVDVGVTFSSHLEDETTKKWDSNVSLLWQQYWGLGDAKANGSLNAVLSTSADLFKQSLFRISPSFTYQYTVNPEDDYLRQEIENHTIRAGVGATIQPGEGAIFSQKFSYNLSGKIYPDHNDISNFVHRIESVTRWNFLPHSSMALTVNFTVSHFLEDERNSMIGKEIVNSSENATGLPVRLKYSLQGLIFARMTYTLGLGYAYAYYTKGKEHMFIMNAKLGYSFRENIDLAVEFRKDFDTALYGDYYKLNRVALTFDAFWFNHLRTKADVGFSAFGFVESGTMIRIDYLTTIKAALDYYFLPGLRLGVTYQFGYNFSDISSAQYAKHTALLNFSYEY